MPQPLKSAHSAFFFFSVQPLCTWQPLQWHTANTSPHHHQTFSKCILATHYHSQSYEYIVSFSIMIPALVGEEASAKLGLMPQNAKFLCVMHPLLWCHYLTVPSHCSSSHYPKVHLCFAKYPSLVLSTYLELLLIAWTVFAFQANFMYKAVV